MTIRDLGSGTGSMRRWLSGRLGVPERWVLQDRDPELLALAVDDEAGVEVRVGEIGALSGAELVGTSLVTASALLDVLTAREVDALVAACVEAGCPALLTLTVTGRVELDPPGPLDSRFEAAFNQHQRRHLLGPDAVAHATAAFEARGATVLTGPSPWRLEPGPLTEQWLRGWIGAACEQDPDLTSEAPDYLRRAGELRAVVGHADLLVIPGERT
ncbi:SAM-dependent methyltransferase [Saccharopolyspora sp. ID03-671]|uniref:SAM-dependent methyltransferase n=1 Tax=Saccharopolyspora sp. ID03-671 TaxID=3073066 RepID=UPI003243643D